MKESNSHSKDRFSKQAGAYSQFRPGYPENLVDDLVKHFERPPKVWDAACGSGQLSEMLAAKGCQVIGTDLSVQQISAAPKSKVVYRQGKAEDPELDSNSFDLVTIAQALHWLDRSRFFQSVQRVVQKGGVLANIWYQPPVFRDQLQKPIRSFAEDFLGDFWDDERRHIDNGFAEIIFPFPVIFEKEYQVSFKWTLDQWVGFVESWSVIQNYRRVTGLDPVPEFRHELENRGYEKEERFYFPFYLKMYRVG